MSLSRREKYILSKIDLKKENIIAFKSGIAQGLEAASKHLGSDEFCRRMAIPFNYGDRSEIDGEFEIINRKEPFTLQRIYIKYKKKEYKIVTLNNKYCAGSTENNSCDGHAFERPSYTVYYPVCKIFDQNLEYDDNSEILRCNACKKITEMSGSNIILKAILGFVVICILYFFLLG